MMKKSILLSLMFIGLISYNAQSQSLKSLSSAASPDLIQSIMSGADVNKEQATGGAGALFGMAKESLNADDFKQVADAVPNMQGMLDAVPAMGGKTSTLSSAATMLTGMPKVQAAFDKLGISKDKVALFTPIIVSYVEKKGGKLLGDKLAKSFK